MYGVRMPAPAATPPEEQMAFAVVHTIYCRKMRPSKPESEKDKAATLMRLRLLQR